MQGMSLLVEKEKKDNGPSAPKKGPLTQAPLAIKNLGSLVRKGVQQISGDASSSSPPPPETNRSAAALSSATSREVVVPQARLNFNRFYHFPPLPELSSATPAREAQQRGEGGGGKERKRGEEKKKNA